MHHLTNRKNVTIAVMVATFLTAMDSTVVSTAMPTIVSDLGGIKLISWVFAAYLLTASVTTPVWGKLSDLFGRKIIFTIGTSLFLLGSMLSGISQTMDQLIWFRAFQGIGAGAVFPITITIIGDIYSFEERAKMQGLFSAIWGISGILGPLVGGFFVDLLSWRWIFYINIPIGLASMFLVWAFLFEIFEKKKKHIDYWGAATFTIGISSFLYALLSGGTDYSWQSPTIILLFSVAVIFLALFLIIEAKSKEPMLPLKLFTIRVIGISNFASFLVSAILIGLNAYLPLWIQGVLGHTATSAGLTLTPMSIGWPIGSTLGGRLMLKIGSRTTSLAGTLIIAGASIWLDTAGLHTSQWVLIAIMVLMGFGFGFCTTAYTVVVQSAVDWNLRGTATASIQFVRNLGQTIGIAVFGTWFNRVILQQSGMYLPKTLRRSGASEMNKLLDPHFARHLPSGLLQHMRIMLTAGLHSVFVILGFIAIAAFIVTIWLPQQKSSSARRAAKPDAAN